MVKYVFLPDAISKTYSMFFVINKVVFNLQHMYPRGLKTHMTNILKRQHPGTDTINPSQRDQIWQFGIQVSNI